MPRKLNPEATTPDIHWKPTKEEDVQLCRDIKRILAENNTGLGDFLRPLLQQKRSQWTAAKARHVTISPVLAQGRGHFAQKGRA